MVSKTFACQLIDESLVAVEHCKITVSSETLSVTVTGSSTLRSFVIDNIDSVLQCNPSSASSMDARYILIQISNDADVVACLESADEVTSLVGAIWQVRNERCEASGKNIKLVRYRLDEPMSAILCPASTSFVKWKQGNKGSVVPYPHSRLDFLHLHTNRSVMFKLSSNDEYRIELSCDGVVAFSSAFEHVGAGSSVPSSVLASYDAAVEWLKSNAASGLVVIVSETSLTLTEPTGFMLLRVKFGDVTSLGIISDKSNPRSRDYQLLSMTFAAIDGVRHDLLLGSKYAMDISNRIRASSAFSRSAAVALPSIDVGFSSSHVAAQQMPRAATVMSNASTQTAADVAVPSTALPSSALSVPEGDAIATILKLRNKELAETVAHRELTIKILQSRCEQLALGGEHRGQGTHTAPSTPRSTGTPRRSTTPRGRGAASQPQSGGQPQHQQRQEVEVLRHYVKLLELALQSERDKRLQERVDQLEGLMCKSESNGEVEGDRSHSQPAGVLQYALVESQREVAQLEDKVRSLQTELRQLSAAQSRTLNEIALRAKNEVQEFVLSYHRAAERPGCAPGLALSGEYFRRLDDFEARLHHEVTHRTRDLMASNAALIEELRDREKVIDGISRDLEGAHSLLDSHIASHMQKKQSLEHAAHAMSRQVEELTRARNDLRDEIRVLFEKSAGEERTQLEVLRQQCALLEKLSNVPLVTSRLASLEVLAAEHEEKTARLMEDCARNAEAQQQLAALRRANEQSALELRKLKSRVHALEQQVASLEAEKGDLQSQLNKTVEAMKAEAREHRKQEKYQRERVQELLATAKRQGTANGPSVSPAPAQGQLLAASSPQPMPRASPALPPSPHPPQPAPQLLQPQSAATSVVQLQLDEERASRIESLSAAMEIIHRHNPTWTAPPQVAADVLAASQGRSTPRDSGGYPSRSRERSASAFDHGEAAPSTTAAMMGVIEPAQTSPRGAGAMHASQASTVERDLQLLRERARSLQLERERAAAEDQVARLQAELVLARHTGGGGAATMTRGATTPRTAANAGLTSKRPSSPSASIKRTADPHDPETMVALARDRFAKMKQRLTTSL